MKKEIIKKKTMFWLQKIIPNCKNYLKNLKINNSSKAQYFLLKKSFVLILYPLFSNISKNVFGSVPFNLNCPGVHSIKIRGT